MILKGAIPIDQVFIPAFLKPHVEIYSTHLLSNTIRIASFVALTALEKALKADNRDISGLFAIICYVNNDEIAFTRYDDDYPGGYLPLIMLTTHRWRFDDSEQERITAIVLEELIHCFYSIRDEIAVKHKVSQVAALVGISISWPHLSPPET